MKKFPVLVAAALASVVVSTATTFAAAPASVAAPTQKIITKPAPVYVVSPAHLPWDLRDATVRMTFTIDENGVPHDVRPVDWMSVDAAKPLIAAVSQWRFRPQMENGKPVSTRVVLPLALGGEV